MNNPATISKRESTRFSKRKTLYDGNDLFAKK